jgi:flagellar M-ring protein FliF
VFGQGHVQAAVNVALNFDKETVSSVVFAPPVEGETGGIVVSMKELYESSREAGGALGAPGTDTNGLGVVEYPYGVLGPDQYYSQVLRELNYEINETRSEVERAQGAIRDLSIAVIIDSEAVKEDYTENVRNLVAQAVGVGSRYVSVERLPLKVEEVSNDVWKAQNDFDLAMKNRELIKTGLTLLALVLLTILIVSFLRTLLYRRPQLNLAGGQVIDYLSPQDGLLQDLAALTAGGDYEGLEAGAEAEGAMPEENITLNTKSEQLEQVEKFIEHDPEAVAQLLRNWLGDEYK